MNFFFFQIATLFSKGKAVGPEELKDILGWPRRKPRSSEELLELETIHDIFDLHLWMRYFLLLLVFLTFIMPGS